MSRFSVELLPEAEAEIRDAFAWYFDRSPLAADAFRTEVFDAIDRLAEQADIWASDSNGLRRYLLSHFPYAVHYELLDDRAVVFAVGHQRRMPNYWKQR